MILAAGSLDELLELFEGERATAMYDEVVTEREHALQAALLAEEAGAGTATVAAALLHDVGRLLVEQEPADRAHERVGRALPAAVVRARGHRPVGLHVAAKRYLCAIEPAYPDRSRRCRCAAWRCRAGRWTRPRSTPSATGPGWEAGGGAAPVG